MVKEFSSEQGKKYWYEYAPVKLGVKQSLQDKYPYYEQTKQFFRKLHELQVAHKGKDFETLEVSIDDVSTPELESWFVKNVFPKVVKVSEVEGEDPKLRDAGWWLEAEPDFPPELMLSCLLFITTGKFGDSSPLDSSSG